MGSQQTKKLQVPNELAQVAGVQTTVSQEVRANGHGQDTQFAVRLALDEALANAIHHGNRDDPGKHLTIEYCVTPDRVQISVCDEGPGFNPRTVPDPTLTENLVKPNGRGIMLMRSYMTAVRYNDNGNCVTLVIQPQDGTTNWATA